MIKKIKMGIYGVGAIGATIGGWVLPRYSAIYFKTRGKTTSVLREKGLKLISSRRKEIVHLRNLKVVENLAEHSNINVIVLSVKNYDLESAAKEIHDVFGDDIVIVALQNGVINQKILPKFFSQIIYGVVCYNSWIESPGIYGFQSKGPIYLGTSDNRLQFSIEEIYAIFNLGFQTYITRALQDAAHSKLVLNLTNALFTLVGLNYAQISSFSKLSSISSSILNEGINIVSSAGFNEHPLGSLVSWKTLRLSQKLPKWLTTYIFRKNVSKSRFNSMAQDVIVNRKTKTELDSINGYIVNLAKSHGADSHFNSILYSLAKTKFTEKEFSPLSIDDLWTEFYG